jgi:imidazolonepropionase-like amidohydrolase
VTTLAGSDTRSASCQGKLDRLHSRNLQLLKKYGVRIAIGSDEYRQTSVREAFYLHRLSVFTNAELLRIWCENTAAAIYPHRNIGHLEEGYEASFLVLRGDPLEDFSNTQKIELRVKQGEILPIGE